MKPVDAISGFSIKPVISPWITPPILAFMDIVKKKEVKII